jgi:hypothetical protein
MHTGRSYRTGLNPRPADPDRWIQATQIELQSTVDWAASLLKLLEEHDPLKTVLAVRDDFLGVYIYDYNRRDCSLTNMR